jgi:hypothetical protein
MVNVQTGTPTAASSAVTAAAARFVLVEARPGIATPHSAASTPSSAVVRRRPALRWHGRRGVKHVARLPVGLSRRDTLKKI